AYVVHVASPGPSTLSLHDALPILFAAMGMGFLALPLAMPSTAQADDFKIHLNLGGWGAPTYYAPAPQRVVYREVAPRRVVYVSRSEEHTSELQSRENLVCRLLLEK